MDPISLAQPLLGPREEELVVETLRSGQIGPGPRVKAFERAFAELHGAAHGVACANGTAAIENALRALGVGPGDEVIVPAFTFIATGNAVLAVGARPVFADIDPATYTLDPRDVAEARTDATRAVIAVHLYGYPADLDGLREAVGDVPIIEDCAQAHLAEYRGRRVGAIGAAGTFSFYPTKNMTAGEGGMILTNDTEVADLARSFLNHGRAPDAELGTYDHVRWGTNARLSDVHAAIGLAQLESVEGWTRQRREHAHRLTKELADVTATPVEREGDVHVYHQYTIRTPERERVAATLRERGIGCGVYYPKVLYAYPHLAEGKRPCPESERAAEEVLSIPVHPALSEDDLDRVVRETRSALGA